MVDDSHSIGQDHWPDVQNGLKSIVSQFEVAPDKVRVAAFTFDYQHDEKGFNFQAHTDTASAVSAVSTLPGISTTLGTFTCEAFGYVRDTVFQPAFGSRPSVPKVLVILTDGKPTDCNTKKKQLKTLAKAARDSGIHIMAIGIGGTYDMKSLQNMASQPYADNVFGVATYDPSTVAKAIIASACGPSGPTPAPAPTPKPCHSRRRCPHHHSAVDYA
jgi:uncharacterized protein YegL